MPVAPWSPADLRNERLRRRLRLGSSMRQLDVFRQRTLMDATWLRDRTDLVASIDADRRALDAFALSA